MLVLCLNLFLQGRAGYAVLNGMLGGKPGLDEHDAEQEDLRAGGMEQPDDSMCLVDTDNPDMEQHHGKARCLVDGQG